MRAIRLTLALLAWAVLYIAAVTFMLSQPARGHDAPSGWSYDLACCSGTDCAPIDSDHVSLSAEGYTVTVAPGDHPLITVPTTYFFPFEDTRVRFAPDGMYHLCVSAITQTGLCLYSPGFSG